MAVNREGCSHPTLARILQEGLSRGLLKGDCKRCRGERHNRPGERGLGWQWGDSERQDVLGEHNRRLSKQPSSFSSWDGQTCQEYSEHSLSQLLRQKWKYR